MTTNKPEILGYCAKRDREPWERSNTYYLSPNPDKNYTVPVIRLSDYEELQSKFEKLQSELDAHKAARIAYASEFPLGADGTPDVGSIHENIRLLKKDAEFGRSVLAKREPGKTYGCHCDLDEGMEPDGCVIDSGERHKCFYAKKIAVKEQCEYWRVIASDAHCKQGVISHDNQ